MFVGTSKAHKVSLKSAARGLDNIKVYAFSAAAIPTRRLKVVIAHIVSTGKHEWPIGAV